MEFVDLSQDPPAKVKVYTLREISGRIPGSFGFGLRDLFEKWINDPKIETPSPAFTFDEINYWKPEQLADWQALKEKMDQVEETERAKSLEDASMTKMKMYESLIDSAQDVVNRNAKCYSHNRGNSMADGRLRAVRLEGQVQLFNQLLLPQVLPSELREKLSSLVKQAKDHVNMQ